MRRSRTFNQNIYIDEHPHSVPTKRKRQTQDQKVNYQDVSLQSVIEKQEQNHKKSTLCTYQQQKIHLTFQQKSIKLSQQQMDNYSQPQSLGDEWQSDIQSQGSKIQGNTILIKDNFKNYNYCDRGPELFARMLAISSTHIHIKTKKINKIIKVNKNLRFDFEQFDDKMYLNFYRKQKLLINFQFDYIEYPQELYKWLEPLKKTFKLNQKQYIEMIFKDFNAHYNGVIKDVNEASNTDFKQQMDEIVFKSFDLNQPETIIFKNYKELIENQIAILKQFNHPNIVKILDYPQSKQIKKGFYMKKIDGQQLKTLLENKGDKKKTKNQKNKEKNQMIKLYKIDSICLKNRKIIMKGILQGLEYIHQKNIVHRDIQPSNIIITPNKDVVIVDFGYATKTDVQKPLLILCGIPGYMAPQIINFESIQNMELTTKSDIFSAGVIFYELAFGEYLFCKNDMERYRKQIIAENKLFKIELPANADVEPIERQLIKKMLELDPKERISAYSQILKIN